MKRAAILLVILAVACGKEGVPHPPVPVIPKETTDLSAMQRGTRVVLSWSYPAFTTTGESLPEVEKIVVYRFRELGPTPLDQVPAAELQSELAPARAAFERIPALPASQFSRRAEELATLTSENLPQFVRGARILYTDQPPIFGEGGEPVRYSYGVVTFGTRGRGAMSNVVSVVPLDAPEPPAQTTAVATEPGIKLAWQAPAGTVLGSQPVRVLGYNVYRLPAEGRVAEPSRSVNSDIIRETEYLDRPTYGAHRYAVAAVMDDGEIPVESELPLMVAAEYKDLTPPPPPAQVRALVEETSVRLVWDPVQAPDFAGYRVYRTIAGGRTELLTNAPLNETFFVDETAALGVEYIYSVTAIDERRNESEPAKTTTVFLAR